MGSVLLVLSPMFRTRLVQLRRAQNLTQQALADETGIHVNQIRRYESGANEPTLEILVRLARALHVSLDALVFDEAERGPSDDLILQFEAVSSMPDEDRAFVKAVLDSLILKYQARRWSTTPSLGAVPGSKPASPQP
jgi:transcriptional regulator with XRE-family HTH domain